MDADSKLEVDYGKLNKRVVFTENEHRHAKFILKLKHDGFKQSQFFRTVITAYVGDNPSFQSFLDEVTPQATRLKKKTRKMRDRGSALLNDMCLSENDVENIFDLIEQEHPEL